MGSILSCGIDSKARQKLATKVAKNRQIETMKNGIEKRKDHIKRFKDQAMYGNTAEVRARGRERLAEGLKIIAKETVSLFEMEARTDK